VTLGENPAARAVALGIAAKACRLQRGWSLRRAVFHGAFGRTWLWRVENGQGAAWDWRLTYDELREIYGSQFVRCYRAASRKILGPNRSPLPGERDRILAAMAAATLAARGEE